MTRLSSVADVPVSHARVLRLDHFLKWKSNRAYEPLHVTRNAGYAPSVENKSQEYLVRSSSQSRQSRARGGKERSRLRIGRPRLRPCVSLSVCLSGALRQELAKLTACRVGRPTSRAPRRSRARTSSSCALAARARCHYLVRQIDVVYGVEERGRPRPLTSVGAVRRSRFWCSSTYRSV